MEFSRLLFIISTFIKKVSEELLSNCIIASIMVLRKVDDVEKHASMSFKESHPCLKALGLRLLLASFLFLIVSMFC